MGFKEDTNDLSNRELEVVLVLVFFLDDFEFILVDLIIFVFIVLLLSHSVVLVNSLVGLIVHVHELFV